MFLLYYPLKQGLKRWYIGFDTNKGIEFLLYYPLKQGLKLLSWQTATTSRHRFYSTIH